MSREDGTRRQVLRYVGAGTVAGSTALYGLSQFTESAGAQVALSFEDATVDLPEDDTIDDLRITGEVDGDFDTGGGPSETVLLTLDVEFDQFGTFSDSVDRHPDEPQGSVSWQPTYSLVEQTEFAGEGADLQSASFDNNTVSYDVTAGIEIEVYADGVLVAESQDSTAGTITFRDPTETQNGDGTDTGGGSSSTSDASVSISFGFEVDE